MGISLCCESFPGDARHNTSRVMPDTTPIVKDSEAILLTLQQFDYWIGFVALPTGPLGGRPPGSPPGAPATGTLIGGRPPGSSPGAPATGALIGGRPTEINALVDS